MHAISTDAILTSVRTRSDNSLGLGFVTPELEPPEMLVFLQCRNINLKLLIQPVGEAPDGIKDVKGEFDQKTPGQRLRASIFVLHRQLTTQQKIAIPFEPFYLDMMNKLIQQVKDQLEPAQF